MVCKYQKTPPFWYLLYKKSGSSNSKTLQKPIFCSIIRTIFTWCPFASAPFLNCSHKICEFPFFLGELEIINIFFISFSSPINSDLYFWIKYIWIISGLKLPASKLLYSMCNQPTPCLLVKKCKKIRQLSTRIRKLMDYIL